MNDVLVSIILPTFNRADWIRGALDSVFAQTWSNWELVIINDGSTDSTKGVVEEYEDPRIVYLEQENQGVSAARNYGISKCSGDVIALLDSDDEWLPHKLEKQMKYMQAHDYAICQTDEIWIRNGKRVNQKKKYGKPEGWFFEESVVMCLISPSCTIFSRSVWDKIGPFDVHMPSCEDYDLWLRACLHYPVGLLREKLTIKHGGRQDQLSVCVPCADIHRIRALVKILQCGELNKAQYKTALHELETKVRIYRQGCEKRGKNEEAQKVWNLFCMVREGNKISPDALL